jgi:L-fuculose-phosphate aldolase
MGRLVADLVDNHNVVLMANHGIVAWGHNVEDACFKIEILETYCRTVLVALRLVRTPNTFSHAQMQDLLRIKQNLGIPDPRFGLEEFDLPDNKKRRRVSPAIQHPGMRQMGKDPKAQAVIQAIRQQILDKFKD